MAAAGSLSSSERDTVLASLAQGFRVDGRGVYDVRRVQFAFSLSDLGHVEVQYGRTRTLAKVSCEAVRPYPDRPTDGFLAVNVEFSPMASARFDGRPTDETIHITRMLERALRQSRAIDTEGLCIVPEEQVWSVRVDVHVLDHDGNIIDCACVAAVAALLRFRRPEVTVADGQVVIHPLDEKPGVPLSVHHTPICVSFGFFEPGEHLVVDPSLLEEQVMSGQMTITMNAQKEVCAVSKAGGTPLSAAQVLNCTKIAGVKVGELHAQIKRALKEQDEAPAQEQAAES
eukprot:Unigene12947_Nuclearia_a/m.39274 Unigene12947_Nuclearia_a/g.39274  ORF Unigene12947_Nuclearia_a/g.39274 Unigene12947_Nuclearia_a/m.39274 type:complete len:286 (+) Unigene12947_Nuclearia_a:21-878(+)